MALRRPRFVIMHCVLQMLELRWMTPSGGKTAQVYCVYCILQMFELRWMMPNGGKTAQDYYF